MNDEELSAYARSRGLQLKQILEFRRECLNIDAALAADRERHRLELSAAAEQLCKSGFSGEFPE